MMPFIRRALRFLGLAAEGNRREEPQVLVGKIQETLASRIGKYNETLAASAGYCEVLRAQIRDLEGKAKSSEARLAAFGRSLTDRSEAGGEALRLESIRQELAELKSQLAEAETTFSKVTEAREAAIREARRELEQLKGMVDDAQFGLAMAEIDRVSSSARKRP